MKILKILLVLSLCFMLFSCTPQPPPQESIEKCLEKGWQPEYYSSIFATKFSCSDPKNISEPIKTELNDFIDKNVKK